MIDELVELLRKELKEQEEAKILEIEQLYLKKRQDLIEEVDRQKNNYIPSFIFLEDKSNKTIGDYLKIYCSKKYKVRAARERELILRFNQEDEDKVKKRDEQISSLDFEKNKKIDDVREKTEEQLSMLDNNDYAIRKLFELKPNLLENEDFVIDLINRDYNYVIYDKTNSPKVYERLFQIWIELSKKKLEGVPEFDIYREVVDGKVVNETRTHNQEYSNLTSNIEMLNKLIEELKNPRQPEPGKYKIPHKYLFESIRKRVFNDICDKTDSNSLVESYLELDCSASLEFGKMIEKLYNDENSTLYGHQIWAGTGSKIDAIESIFYEGLQMNYDNDMTRTTVSSKSSFVDLGYFLQHTSPLILLSIPNDKAELFGCNDKQDDYNPYKSPIRTYLLPEFVIGAVNGKDGLAELETEFIKNDIPVDKRKKYEYYSTTKGNYSNFEEQLSSFHR